MPKRFFLIAALLTASACEHRAGPPPAAALPPFAPRVALVVTEEGFVPKAVRAKVGEPLTLLVTRKTDQTCATALMIEGQEGKTELPLEKTVEVKLVPKAAGVIKFGCTMGMMIGG